MTSASFIAANGALMFRAVAQAGSLLIITRLFPVADYGLISALVALTVVAAPLAGLGMETLIVRVVVARADGFPGIWGQALASNAAIGLLLSLVITAVAAVALPVGLVLPLIFMVALSDLVFGRWLEYCGRAYLAHGHPVTSAWISSSPALLRLLGLLCLWLLPVFPSLELWAVSYAFGAYLPATALVAWCSLQFGAPRWDLGNWWRNARQGLTFALDQTSDRARSDADKIFLINVQGAEITGWYTLACRFIGLASIPTNAFLYISYTPLFTKGRHSPESILRYTLTSIRRSLTLTVLLALLVAVFARPAVAFFGANYEASARILATLAPLIPLLLLRQTFANALGAIALERYRLLGSVSALLVNLLLNLLLIPIFGWLGSAIAILVSELLLVTIYAVVLLRRTGLR